MLTFLSLNVNGLRDQSKRAGLMQWLQSLSVVPDVVCLQESHCVSVEECRSWFLSSGFSFVSSPGTHKSCGCIILFRPCLSLVSSQSDASGRFISCDFSLHDVSFCVVCVYAPNHNPDHDSFLDGLSEWMDPAVPTILAGDFNTILDRALDRQGSVASDVSRESSVALARLFRDACCLDIWRYLHPSARLTDRFWISTGRWPMVFSTLRTASLVLVTLSTLFASVTWPPNALLTCSFPALWRRVFSLGYSPCYSPFRLHVLLWFVVTFFLVSTRKSCTVFLVFLCTFLMFVNILSGLLVMILVSVTSTLGL